MIRRKSKGSLGKNSLGRATEYEELKHPNLVSEYGDEDSEESFSVHSLNPNSKRVKRKNRTCIHYFKVIDDQVLRPIFIYKYERIRK